MCDVLETTVIAIISLLTFDLFMSKHFFLFYFILNAFMILLHETNDIHFPTVSESRNSNILIMIALQYTGQMDTEINDESVLPVKILICEDLM